MIKLKYPHPNYNTVQPARADRLRLLWYWLQDHCDNGTHRLIDVYKIHGNRIAHNDAAGNLIGVLTGTGAQLYAYNARGRLAASVIYENAQGTRSNTYALNGLGQRIRKTGYGVSTGTHRYVYDAQGHLLGDYTSTGVAIQETVYLGDIPVAVLQGTAVYHLHADHLDTPRVITDSTNKVIWRWDSDPFGATAANEDPDGDRKKFTYNLRFPGQYFDKETGLHYNYFRDYDPKIGRYVQSDPIGLAGGLNTYAYVANNPLRFTDPMGLMGSSGMQSPSSPGASASCDGRWRKIRWIRDPFSAFTLTCTCYWSCTSCPNSGKGDAFSDPNFGQYSTKGKIIFSGKPGVDYDPEAGDACQCGEPGSSKGCDPCGN